MNNRERAWTAEQHDNKLIAALQSARDRMMRAITLKFGDAFDGDFDVMLDAINHLKRQKTATLRQQAALAQNAQEEAAVEIVEWQENASPRLRFFTKVSNLPAGTKLYTHAERARVPDWKTPAAEWLALKAREQRATNEKFPDHAACYPAWGAFVTRLEMLASELLAAAPSQPEDAKCSHTWVTDGIGPTRCSKCHKQPEDAA